MSSITSTRSETVTDLVRSLYGIAMIQREINRHALAELGTQGFSALAIVGLQGPLRVSDVAARLHVDLSVASRQIAALDRAGHVTRTPDGDDRRALVVAVTDHGRAVLADTHRRMVEAFGEALGDWSEDDIAALAAALSRLRADFETDPHPRIATSLVVQLADQTTRWIDYRDSNNRPLLHRKEEFVASDHPQANKWRRLTQREQAWGLYDDPARIGLEQGWADALEAKNAAYRGSRLVRRTSPRP